MASERITPNRPTIIHETFDNEVIIINVETGAYYGLAGTGVDVWRGVEQGASRQQLIDAILCRYPAERDAVATAVNTFVDELLHEEIVVLEQRDDGTERPFALDQPSETLPFVLPALSKFTDMADLLLLDPIHDVDEQGWPNRRPE
jgi:hypothetical protein